MRIYHINFQPIDDTIEAIKYDIACYRSIVQIKRKNDKSYQDIFLIDKDLNKSPQKHKFWNHVVSKTIKLLNTYYHNDNCEKNCKETHEKAHKKVSELLKIFYPSIWIEDVTTIASRIKQKNYRGLPR